MIRSGPRRSAQSGSSTFSTHSDSGTHGTVLRPRSSEELPQWPRTLSPLSRLLRTGVRVAPTSRFANLWGWPSWAPVGRSCGRRPGRRIPSLYGGETDTRRSKQVPCAADFASQSSRASWTRAGMSTRAQTGIPSTGVTSMPCRCGCLTKAATTYLRESISPRGSDYYMGWTAPAHWPQEDSGARRVAHRFDCPPVLPMRNSMSDGLCDACGGHAPVLEMQLPMGGTMRLCAGDLRSWAT